MILEDLRHWFSKSHPKGNWVRINTKGEIAGPCAREPGEGKPKCLPLAKARAMSKDDRATAARRKRREDPVADRPGKGGAPVNVKTEAANPAQQAAIAIALIKAGKKKGKDPGPQKEDIDKVQLQKTFSNLREGLLVEKSAPTNPELWSRAKALAKSKFDVYPSAYANGWAAKWYKSKGGSWRTAEEVSCELVDDSELGIVEEVFTSNGKELYEDWGEIAEANDGKTLNKPFLTPGGPKKRAVYVKNDKGNVVKVSFGDPNLSIKRDDPERRRSFRARHNCDNPGPKWKARYWSCKYWSSTPVSN